MEKWKPVLGWENSHEVSSFGSVRSKNRILLQQTVEGYPSVTLCANGQRKRYYVHHLVALAFVGSPPGNIGTKRGEYTVNHKDLNKQNNHYENLEWLTCGENYVQAYEQGAVKIKSGVEVGNSKLTPDVVQQIKQRLDAGEKPVDIASDYGVVKGTVYAIKNGTTWK